jgi:uncharacterized protein (DUF2141 family)
VHLLTVVALGTLGVCLPALASDPGLHVTVTGLKHDGATVRCALFAHADGFPKDGAAAVTATGSVTGGRATCSFPTLPSGTYALAAFEDRNGNGRLDRNALGFPVEGYAFSRDARGRFGPPKFDAAAFAHDGGKNTLQLRAAY